MRRYAAFSLLAWLTAVVGLPSPVEAAVVLQFDYRYDTSGFFALGSPARGTLEAAGGFFESLLADDLTAIDSEFRNHFHGVVTRPDTGDSVTLSNLDVPADTIMVFVGARDLGGGTLGRAGPNGYTVSYVDQPWYDNVRTRGEGAVCDVEGPTATEYAPWGGSLTMDIDTAWNLDHAVMPSGGQSDLYSTVLHELGHVLGLGVADSWDNLIDPSNQFTGAESVAEFGREVPLEPGGVHWASGTRSTVYPEGGSQEAAMDPELTVGTRKQFTDLDVAALDDVGWDIRRPVAFWSDPGGGSFFDANNWEYGQTPDPDDAVVFELDGTYGVGFSGNALSRRLLLRDGNVTFNLGGHTYSVSTCPDDLSVVVGESSGENAALTISNGTLAAHDASVAMSPGTLGRVTVSGAGARWELSDRLSIGGSGDAGGGSGTVTVNQGASLDVSGTLRVRSGDYLYLNGGAATAGRLELIGGTVTGSGNLTLSASSSQWTGGTMSGEGTTTVGHHASLLLTGSAIKWLDGRGLDNAGEITWSGQGDLVADNAAVIDNLAGALFDVRNDASLTVFFGAAPTINNAGTFRKSAGTGTTELEAAFTNTGTVEVQSGTLQLLGGGTSSGTFDLADGTKLTFGGDHQLQGDAVVRLPLADQLMAVTGSLTLGGTLELRAEGRFGPQGSYGNQPDLTLIATQSGGSLHGHFGNYPPGHSVVGPDGSRPHLGYGVFLGDAAGTGVAYDEQGGETVAVRARVLQAAPGDTDGDRQVNSRDILAIKRAQTFNNPDHWPCDWPQGDFDADSDCDSRDVLAIKRAGEFNAGTYASALPEATASAGPGLVELLVWPDGTLVLDAREQRIDGFVIESLAGDPIFDPALPAECPWNEFVTHSSSELSDFTFDSAEAISGTYVLGAKIPAWVVSDWGRAVEEELAILWTWAGPAGYREGYAGVRLVPEPGSGLALAAGLLALLPIAGRRRGRRRGGG